MPFALDSNPSNIELSDAINYLLGNFGANLSADPNTGLITGPTGQTIAYLYKYLSIRYADSADGALNFSDSPTNRLYYGARNNNSSVESTNPADYIWLRVAGGFSTTKFLFYKVSGGRQIEFFVGTTAPGYGWEQDSGAAIDLDAISVVITATPTIYQWTATSTPPARPTTTTTYTWATGTYTAPAGWSIDVPSNTTPGAFLWEISITIVQTGGINTEVLDWTNPIYAIRAVGYNGEDGAPGTPGAPGNSALTAYRAQDQSLAPPSFTTPTAGPNAPAGWTLGTPSVSVGQVLWYLQGEYNSSATLTINGVAPNTTRWTGPIAASVFQDIRSDNWNGSNPPTFGNPATWGTAGYYISRSTGTAILNNLGARGTLQSGTTPAISGTTMTGAGAVINSNGTFAVGDSSNNITYNGVTVTLNGQIVTAGNLNVSNLQAVSANTGNLTVTGTFQANTAAISGTTMTGSGAVLYSSGSFAVGDSANNITYNGTTITLNGQIVTAGNLNVANLEAVSANTGSLTVTGTFQANTAVISGTGMSGSGGVLYSSGNFAFGNSTTNISFNGSQMTLNGNVVATGNINLNAVTVPVSSFTSGEFRNSSLSVWENIQTISITTTGQRVYIASAANVLYGTGLNGDTDVAILPTYRLVRDSTELMQSNEAAMSYSETPGAGTYTYRVQCISSNPFGATTITSNAGASNRSLFVIETKR